MFGERVRCERYAVLLLAMVVLGAMPAAAQAKPDLVVAGQTVVDPAYFVRAEGNATFGARIKNKGDSKAKASEASLVLVHAPEVRETAVASRDVPKLKPGKSEFVSGGDSVPGLPPGAYDAIVCADYRDKVKEKNESNNCADLGQVYVIVGSWFGTLSGDGPTSAGGSTRETWQSGDAEFRLTEYLGDGRFAYNFFGSVTFTVTGTGSDDCEYSGTDTFTVAGDGGGQGLILDFRKEEYFGNDAWSGFPTDWHMTCDGFDAGTTPGPMSVAGGVIVVNPEQIDTKPMPFGSTGLSGSSADPNGSNFAWLLGAGN